MIRTVDQLECADRRVFVRVDFNVPLTANGGIADDTRLQRTLPTLKYLLAEEARVICASHLGRPKGGVDPKYSLLPVAEQLTELLGCEVLLPETVLGDAVTKLARDLKSDQVLLLENLRFHPGEEANDEKFARSLAALADLYVDDAFGAMHRAHASTAGMVAFFQEKGMGFLVREELNALTELMTKPKRPFWAILGGAKVSSKIGVIGHLLDKVDGLILGGALAYTFLKARGVAIGASPLEASKLHLARKVLEKAADKGVPLLLPLDHLVSAAAAGAPVRVTADAKIPAGLAGFDIGPKTIAAFQKALDKAATIFWNGPLGFFEQDSFAAGTKQVAQTIGASGATTVVGGGDSIAALKRLGLERKISFLSTGGGASLEFLEGKTLPGLKALELT